MQCQLETSKPFAGIYCGANYRANEIPETASLALQATAGHFFFLSCFAPALKPEQHYLYGH